MGLGKLLRRLFFGAPPPPISTRLSEAEVIELAKRVVGKHALLEMLNVATAHRRADGAVIWTVRTNGIGSFVRVVIDDANGAILEQTDYTGR